MPSAPPTLCACGQPKQCGKCPRCGARREHRLSAARRGYDWKWRNENETGAADYYLKANPLCAECKWYGRTVPAFCVDHKRPHRGNLGLFWDTDNWQALCEKCHNVKTCREEEAMSKYVVCGPPGAGKTTWVKARAKAGDLVFDADYLMATLFNTPLHAKQEQGAALVERLRSIVVDWLLQYPDRKAYIIQADCDKATQTAYTLGAELVTIDQSHRVLSSPQ